MRHFRSAWTGVEVSEYFGIYAIVVFARQSVRLWCSQDHQPDEIYTYGYSNSGEEFVLHASSASM